ncbi:BnaAnng10430D [Brassica napus]|uniref:BnaAnng10430D protein n=1 Tax=Brassica napus TaxID=3708 RepID=A0A078ILQ3_BRANA|nr:BnaAnng10430D [Brassica napus]
MANSYTVLADLRAGRCFNTAEVRLLRFWEAKNINKRGQQMSVEMLLVDEHVIFHDLLRLLQGSISVHRLNTFRHVLQEGSAYELSVFDVARSNPSFKFGDSLVSIRYVGEVGYIRTVYNKETHSTQCHMATIRHDRDTPLCLSVFDGLQRSWMLGSDVEPKVVLANNIKSNLVRVKNQLSVNICTLGSPH